MKIKDVKQTVFINKQGLNKVYLYFEDIDQNLFLITVKIGDETYIKEWPEEEKQEVAVYLPVSDREYKITVIVDKFGQREDTLHHIIKPVKKWKVAFIASSHEDIGFCEYANELGAGCADFLDAAMDIMDKDSSYRYVIEHYWWLKAYEDYRDEDALRRLQKYLDSGNLELAAVHSGVHVHLHGHEQIPRSTYYTRRLAKKDWNTDPVTALYADISAMAWSGVSAYAGAGIKYFVNLYNNWRNNDYDQSMPRFFRWLAPNGKDSLICWIQREYNPRAMWHTINDVARHYKEGEFVFTGKEKKISDLINERIELLGDVPFDLLPISYYDDREPPTSTLVEVCKGLNSLWEYPKFEMGLPSVCLDYIEKTVGEQLPVFSGDMTDQWADFCTIAPLWMANKRYAQNMFPVAETLSVIASLEQGTPYPKNIFEETMWRMCEFDEHCWATSIKEPLGMHKYNLALVKEQSALVAKRNVDDVISKQIATKEDGDFAVVLNALPHNRKTMLTLNEGMVLDDTVCQRMTDGHIITEPIELPSYGIKSFRLKAGQLLNCQAFAEISDGIISTGFYNVGYDEENGEISSIFDNESKRELLDIECRERLGDFIYVNSEPTENKNMRFSTAKNRGYKIENGPLAVSIIRTSYEESLCANVCSIITFYKYERNIDVKLKFSGATGLMGEFSDRYRKNIFFAFPFKVDGSELSPCEADVLQHEFKFYTELVGGVVDESTQRLKIGPKDFVIPQNWVAAENNIGGIALYTKEMPVFHLGAINLNKFLNSTDYKKAHIYLHGASNRSNQLSFYSPEMCRGEYNLSIFPYQGSWRDCVPMWSLEKAYPPIIGKSNSFREEKSYFELDSDNVMLTALKRSEDSQNAIVARFLETTGRKTRAQFSLPFDVLSAGYTDIVENEIDKEAEISGNSVAFDIDGFSYTTLKISGKAINIIDDDKPFATVRNIFAIPHENRAVILSWEKHDYKDINGFEIFADGNLVKKVKNGPYRVQFCEIPSLDYSEFVVKPV